MVQYEQPTRTFDKQFWTYGTSQKTGLNFAPSGLQYEWSFPKDTALLRKPTWLRTLPADPLLLQPTTLATMPHRDTSLKASSSPAPSPYRRGRGGGDVGDGLSHGYVFFLFFALFATMIPVRVAGQSVTCTGTNNNDLYVQHSEFTEAYLNSVGPVDVSFSKDVSYKISTCMNTAAAKFTLWTNGTADDLTEANLLLAAVFDALGGACPDVTDDSFFSSIHSYKFSNPGIMTDGDGMSYTSITSTMNAMDDGGIMQKCLDAWQTATSKTKYMDVDVTHVFGTVSTRVKMVGDPKYDTLIGVGCSGRLNVSGSSFINENGLFSYSTLTCTIVLDYIYARPNVVNAR